MKRFKKFLSKCGKCAIWGDKFWNSFFHPHNKGIFIVVIHAVALILFTLGYIYVALYYEAFCNEHANAYLIMFFSNIIQLIVDLFVLHLLTTSLQDVRIIQLAVIYGGLIISLVLSTVALLLWNTTPTNENMKEYVANFFRLFYRVPRIHGRLHRDYKCCGIDGFEDFIPEDDRQSNQIKSLPPSCCLSNTELNQFSTCGNFRGMYVNESKTVEEIRTSGQFYLRGCFVNSTFEDLHSKSGSAYYDTQAIFKSAFFSLPLLILLTSVVSYYVCYKMVKEVEEDNLEIEWEEDVEKLEADVRWCFCYKRTGGNNRVAKNSETSFQTNKNNLETKPSLLTNITTDTGTTSLESESSEELSTSNLSSGLIKP